VLVLEDLHWADSASLDLLRFIAHGIDEMPILLLATYRAEELDRRHPLAALVPLLVREAPTERLGLRPLDTAAAQELVRVRHDLAEPAVQRLAAYLIARTEGNALLSLSILVAHGRLSGGTIVSHDEFSAIAPGRSPCRDVHC
jgi:predicted ATPase